jgi:radical SAM superfamily enzyme with C-terminal helix-hairpin-helix motif
LALISPTSGGHLAGIVRSRTKAMAFFLFAIEVMQKNKKAKMSIEMYNLIIFMDGLSKITAYKSSRYKTTRERKSSTPYTLL